MEGHLTKLIYTKQESQQANPQLTAGPTSQAAQILHLKRLLVTLKHHYEKSLQQLQIQLQVEQNQRLESQKELKVLQAQFDETQTFHEEELEALRLQQTMLKELLKKAQDELAQQNETSSKPELPHLDSNDDRKGHLDLMMPFLREQTAETNLEVEQLRDELNESQKKVRALQQDLVDSKENYQKDLDALKQLLEEQNNSEGIETVVSTTSSRYLRIELDNIKRIIAQGNQEAKTLESQYVEVLNEKIGLENKCKQLQLQLEHQSSNLIAFQEQMHDLIDSKKGLEASSCVREADLLESIRVREELEKRIVSLNSLVREKDLIQEKYEQLKEEWKQLNERLEEVIEIRVQADVHIHQLESIAANQECQLQAFTDQLQTITQEKESLEIEKNQLKLLLEESEARMKIAQQHLAKKVKEAAVLTADLEEQQASLKVFVQTVEHQKVEIAQCQAGLELYQKQEKRLQDQLHEALKGTESQIEKWEKKYFEMYDKWQESENRVRELKKLEERHLHMQNLLSNIGNFMGVAANSSPNLVQSPKDATEKPLQVSFPFDTSMISQSIPSDKYLSEGCGEKFDLFGMRQPPENPHSFS